MIDFRELWFYLRMSALGWIVGIAGLALLGWLEIRGAIGSALGFLIGFLWGLFCNLVFPPWQRIREGFHWWTVGAGLDGCQCGHKLVWLKLGPVTLTFTRGRLWSFFEIHCMNRLRYVKEFRKLAA